MAQTKLQICNSALIKLGAEVIPSLDQESKRAKLCDNQYEVVKTKLLRSHPWNFAVTRASLTNDGVTPAFGYTYQFDLPVDCLKILQAMATDTSVEYKIEGRKILTDEETLNIMYVADVSEEVFDTSFAEILALALAADIAYAMNQSNEFAQSLKAELEQALRPARSFDAQEGTPQDLEASAWLDVRY